jgi:predicted RNase H-like nuclease (RuvC/YqgF family)
MAKLTSKQRNALPDSAFAGPHRSFPVNDPSHARNALARASQFHPELKSKLKTKIKKKFPGIKMKMDGGKVCQRADRSPRRK